MSVGQALRNLLLVAVVLGALLSTVFGPLMEFERLMGNQREYRIWLGEWVTATLLLTALLCRQELRALVRRKPSS
ncbi:MAG: hypothetical protein HY656_01050 [Acidobacteria bacterium]|nr:hypothetical protein [Acidobacteriota bacterium]